MSTIQRHSSASAFVGLAFGRKAMDAMSVPEPRISGLVCNVWNEVLREEDNGNGGGGGGSADDKKFSQADLDGLIQKRVGKLTDELKAAKEGLAKLADLEKRLADADSREQAAREEAEMKGKSELEKLQIQLKKREDADKSSAAEWAKKLSDSENAAKAATEKFTSHVKRTAVTEALVASGALGSAIGDAALSFLSEAQVEMDENHAFKSIVVGGKSFEKPTEAAKHFLTTKPWYAAKAEGGGGNPRNGGAPGPSRGDVTKTGADDDFAVGFSTPAKA